MGEQMIFSSLFLALAGAYAICAYLWHRADSTWVELEINEIRCDRLQKQIYFLRDVIVENEEKNKIILRNQLDTIAMLTKHIKSMDRQYIRKFPVFDVEGTVE